MRQPGFFISIEGGEKAGKTTQATLLADRLRKLGHEVVLTREPGGTKTGEAIREILLQARTGGSQLDAVCEALLFAASRAQLVAAVIRPALRAGRIVVADRYVDSTLAYQAAGLGLPYERVRATNDWATGALYPDLTILLDLGDLEVSKGRTRSRQADRIEKRRVEFHRRVARAFRDLAANEPDRYVIIDASSPVEEVAARIEAAVTDRLARKEGS